MTLPDLNKKSLRSKKNKFERVVCAKTVLSTGASKKGFGAIFSQESGHSLDTSGLCIVDANRKWELISSDREGGFAMVVKDLVVGGLSYYYFISWNRLQTTYCCYWKWPCEHSRGFTAYFFSTTNGGFVNWVWTWKTFGDADTVFKAFDRGGKVQH